MTVDGTAARCEAARTGRAIGLLAAMVADAVFADPRRGHPVAAFGAAAIAVERPLYGDSRLCGAVYAAGCAGAAVGAGYALQRLARGHRLLAPLAVSAVGWTVLGGASLTREAERVAAALAAGDTGAARARLPYLCGRDPAALDATELARAAIESVAENTADAVAGPLLWGAVAGMPGLLGYRAVNTLDAMVGHRGVRYGRFGWAAARLDDAATWVPARVTALLAAAAAPLVGGSAPRAPQVLARDGSRNPSPNAGRCEAAFAGALGVRLGGSNRYGGRVDHRPGLGEGRTAGPDDILRAIRLSRAVGWAAAVLASGLSAAPAARTAFYASARSRRRGRARVVRRR